MQSSHFTTSRFAFGLVVALLTLAETSGVLGAGVSGADTSTCGSLSLGEGPPVGGVSGSDLTDVGFVSLSESWAVGDVYDAALHAHQTLIERFDGSAWSVVPSPNQSGMNNGLNSVSMTPGGGWAVGYALEGPTSGPKYQPLALHWDGTRWSSASPAAFPSDTVLTGVDTLADGTAWAAGFYTTTAGGTRRTLIEHASGGAWTQVASPNDGTSRDNTLMAVGGTQATGLWAVGYWLSRTGLKPLVLRYNTALPSPSWVSVSGAGGVPSPGTVDTVLTGVDVVTASDVWAVGYYDNGAGTRPLVLHWNGSTWNNSPVPGIGLLRKVREITPGNVWAIGSYYNAAENRTMTLVVHFGGTKWSTVQSADSTVIEDNQLMGLAANQTGSMITVVGSQGLYPLIEQARCPTGPVSLPSRAAPPVPPAPTPPGVGPAPSPPPTPPPTTPIPVAMVDRAAAAGISGPPDKTWSAVTADLNGDGWPDIFVGQHGYAPHLWINNHNGTFSLVNAGFASRVDRHDCVAGDFNQDGLMDMFCSVGADRGVAVKANELYIQQPGHAFVNQAYQWHVTDPLGRGRYSAVLDVNNDGYPDIFSGSSSLRPDGMPAPDRLFLNTGHGSFIDSPSMGLDLGIGAGCAHAVDYNSDGWPDLLVCGRYDTTPLALHLFRNNQGHGFTDVSSIMGPPIYAQDAVMVDVNHDNRPDLITLTTSEVAERLQLPNGTFGPPKTILKVQDGLSLAVGDVNGDHNPDIYVVCGRAGNANAPDYLLIGNATGGFTTMKIPETTVGQGDIAYPIDYTRDGLTSFLVLNGRGAYPGVLQLLTPIPRSASSNRSAVG
jgi:hypothetical protein